MQFRCFSCGFKFSDGLPPMEALSEVQAGVVGGVEDSEDRFTLLVGTPYEGMSTYNFCTFCITAIRDFPSAQFGKSSTPGHKMRFTQDNTDEMRWEGLECECSETLYMHVRLTDDQVFRPESHYERNRLMVLHLARLQYRDVSELEKLLMVEA